MLNQLVLDWQSYRFFPYERRLARREVETLLGSVPEPCADGLVVTASKHSERAIDRFTYFRLVRRNGAEPLVPLQARLESSAAVGRTGVHIVGPHRRQRTRYSSHGLHEYKGKFHPQIVRATANVLNLPKSARILDPFCGSGTSLVEAAHAGWNALGVDMNPLAVLIAEAKLSVLRLPVSTLRAQVDALTSGLSAVEESINCDTSFSRATLRMLGHESRAHRLPNEDYLRAWFSPSVLAQLRVIAAHIDRLKHAAVQAVARVVLSDLLRTVSLQDPADLRVRRRTDALDNYPVIDRFLGALQSKVSAVLNAREVLGAIRGRQRAVLADARQRIPGTAVYDAVITSPPYATALPYIDTQRLSLAFLGLVPANQLRLAERRLIGNREITNRERQADERALLSEVSRLPDSVFELCSRALRLASGPSNGFRRRNVPALLFRYFSDMRQVLERALPRVKRDGAFAMVVGPNRTTLSGEPLTIDTPHLLVDVAQAVGWKIQEVIALDAYQRFDLHQENSITSEKLILLRR